MAVANLSVTSVMFLPDVIVDAVPYASKLPVVVRRLMLPVPIVLIVEPLKEMPVLFTGVPMTLPVKLISPFSVWSVALANCMP